MASDRKVSIALWFDKGAFRIAGVYLTERAAWKRVNELGSGTVQTLQVGKKVRFTHEEKA